MPRKEPLRPLRRVFKRLESLALATGFGEHNFDQEPRLADMSISSLIDVASRNPTLRTNNKEAQLEAVRSSLLVLCFVEQELTKQVRDTQGVEDG